MKSDLVILQQMIKNSAQLALIDDYGKKQVILTEPQCPTSVVNICGLPDDVIVIKADDFKSPDTLFNGSHDECKRADFLIIAASGDKKIILCIEMKARKSPENEIIKQLTGTQCLVAYIREIGKSFWQQPNFLNGYVYRFISISHTRLAKSKTRIKRQPGIHDRPERMLKIAYPHHLQFNHLAGRNC
jgi:hypothetical protein